MPWFLYDVLDGDASAAELDAALESDRTCFDGDCDIVPEAFDTDIAVAAVVAAAGFADSLVGDTIVADCILDDVLEHNCDFGGRSGHNIGLVAVAVDTTVGLGGRSPGVEFGPDACYPFRFGSALINL